MSAFITDGRAFRRTGGAGAPAEQRYALPGHRLQSDVRGQTARTAAQLGQRQSRTLRSSSAV
jgi:hypothetical protein